MKIRTNNAGALIKQAKALQVLAEIPLAVFPHDGVQLFEKLRRLELKAHRLRVIGCDRNLTTSEESTIDRIEKKVRDLLPGLNNINNGYHFFINGDPRGYALKLQGPDEGGKLPEGINTDWGGYGILAPEL